MINVREFSIVILSEVMDVVSFGSGDNLSNPQYHFKMIFIAFRLLVLRIILPHTHGPLVSWHSSQVKEHLFKADKNLGDSQALFIKRRLKTIAVQS